VSPEEGGHGPQVDDTGDAGGFAQLLEEDKRLRRPGLSLVDLHSVRVQEGGDGEGFCPRPAVVARLGQGQFDQVSRLDVVVEGRSDLGDPGQGSGARRTPWNRRQGVAKIIPGSDQIAPEGSRIGPGAKQDGSETRVGLELQAGVGQLVGLIGR